MAKTEALQQIAIQLERIADSLEEGGDEGDD